MQEHLVSPYATLHCTPTGRGRDGQVFKNWDPYVNAADDLPTALAASCDTYFYQARRPVLRPARERGHPLQDWASRFGFGRRRASTSAPRQRAPADAGVAAATSRRRPTALADRPALEAGRLDPARDRPEGPARHAAADGALLRADRERRQARDAAHRSLERRSEPGRRPRRAQPRPPPQPSRRRPGGARASSATGLYEATHARRHVVGVFGAFPIPIAGKTGTAEKVDPAAGLSAPCSDQSWWCGYGPYDDADARRLRPDRERRPRRRGRGAGGAEGVRAVLPRRRRTADRARSTPTDGRRRRHAGAPARPPSGAPRASAVGASFLRRLDWVLLAAVAALVAYGSGRSTGSRTTTPGDPSYYVAARWSYVAVGVVGFVARARSSTRTSTAATAAIYVGRCSADAARASLAAPVARGSQRWIDLGFFRFQPSEFGKLLFVLVLAGFLADRAGGSRAADDARARRARRDADRCSSSSSRTRHGARLRRRARRRALRRRHAAGCTWPRSGRRAARRRSASSGCCPPPASTC